MRSKVRVILFNDDLSFVEGCMKSYLKIFLIPVIVIALMQIATPVLAAPVWSDALTIKYMEGNSEMTVYFNETVPNPAGCSQGALNSVSWDSTNPAAKNFMSMLLTAKATGRQIQVLVDDSSCLWGGWPSLLTVRLL